MVALWNRAHHYILMLWFVLLLLLLSSPNLSCCRLANFGPLVVEIDLQLAILHMFTLQGNLLLSYLVLGIVFGTSQFLQGLILTL